MEEIEKTEYLGLEDFLKANYQFCQFIKPNTPWDDHCTNFSVCDRKREQEIERVNIEIACCLH